MDNDEISDCFDETCGETTNIMAIRTAVNWENVVDSTSKNVNSTPAVY